MTEMSTVHASAVLAGEVGILIRGPSGAGKSRLAFDLILAGRAGQIAKTMLVGDDRVLLSAAAEGVTVRPAGQLEGLIEVRGLGIRRCDFVPKATVRLVVDLAAQDSARVPEQGALAVSLYGIKIPRIPIGPDFAALPVVIAALLTRPH